ncbi:hypothetical protein B296_00003616 [Ensete ventricosum]|uniref:DUF641 domain-containing protein n=1 Tax=Ensete ventricosum TaxID=4639 RepID=A0A427B794_ENSVE|nr:hypothetical protein B296_00003616 [Ensete ventricosum]
MFVSFVRLGGTSPENLEASTSVASSRAPSPVDAKALQDLQVIKTCHDFDSTVSEGSLVAIRERYSILGMQSHHYQMALFDHVHDAGRLVTIMDHRATNFQQEIEELKSGGSPKAVAVADLKKENEKLLAKLAEMSIGGLR